MEDDGEGPSADWFLRNSCFIRRFMIDRRHRGKGCGREAMRLALAFIRTFPAGEAKYCRLSCEPENAAAGNLYLSFGFEEQPQHFEEGQEMPAVLKLQSIRRSPFRLAERGFFFYNSVGSQ